MVVWAILAVTACANNATSGSADHPSAESAPSAADTFLGILLCLSAAFLLAFSMNVQQFALTCDEDARVLKFVSRNVLWVMGLIIYLIAQLNFVVALSYGPFAIISAVFTTVLIFDNLIAYFALKRVPSKHEAAGLAIILMAVIR